MNSTGRDAAHNPYGEVLRGLRSAVFAAILFSALINVLMLTGSIYMLQVYDRVLSSGSVPTLLGLFAVVILLYGFLGLYDMLRGRILARAAMRLDVALAPRAFTGWIGGVDGGQLASTRPLRDIETLRGFLSGPGVTALFDLPWVPLFLGVLFILHPWLGWLTVAGAGIGALLALATRQLSRKPIAAAAGLEAADREFIEQGRGAAEAIRAMGMAGWVTAAWQRRHLANLSMQQAAGASAETLGPVSRSFRMLLQSAILTLGAWLVLRHELTAGMIVASSVLSGRALAPIDQVVGQWRMIGRALESHQRLREAFAGSEDAAPRLQLPPPSGLITVDRVTKFVPGRTGADRPRMLTQVSFDLAPGDGLGVIGASASGKTTLARLLVGAWVPDAGEIRFDGATRDQWSPEAIGRSIGYLPQQVRMLPGTIAQNISRFDPEASDADVIAAARLTGVHDMILTLPEGYATHLGGGNDPLSGGQVQRLGLARAIYRMPRIVVLDEPNSNLDSAGDDALALAVTALRRAGSAVVVMSHRPSGLAAVNKVLVLRGGVVTGFGDKTEVLRAALEPRQIAGPPAAAPQPVSAISGPSQPARSISSQPGPPQPDQPQPGPPQPGLSQPDQPQPGPTHSAPRPTPAARVAILPTGARAKIVRTRSGSGRELHVPDRGTSVWPPLPPMPDLANRPEPAPPAARASGARSGTGS